MKTGITTGKIEVNANSLTEVSLLQMKISYDNR
jgi:hypothetical protein